ncbi:hypothetical protein PSHT_02140, partial [Puccinia striiformis]
TPLLELNRMAHNKGYQKKRRNENCDRTKSKKRSFQISLVDEPTALPQDDPNSTDTQILWLDHKLEPTELYPCPTGVSITQKPTPDEIKAAQEIAREFHYYTEKKVVVMDRSKGFQVIALIKFTPLDQLSESEKLELNIIAKFLRWVRRYVDTVGSRAWGGSMYMVGWRKSLDSFQLMGRYRHQATITESPEDYDTLMRNLAPCASDILGVIFKNHANVAFEDNRKKMKDANIPAMAALKFDAPLSPNNSAPNLSFTRDGFFNKIWKICTSAITRKLWTHVHDSIHSFQSIKISLLEHEAADVAKEVKETDIVMQEVNQVTAQYIPFTQASSSIFFILQQLNVLNHFYQFSLQYFLDILKFVLPDENNWHLLGVRDPRERLTVVFNNICLITFEQTSRALLHRDHLVLAMSLAQLQAQASGDKIDDDDVSYLSEGDSDCTGRQPPANLPFLLIKQQANKLFNNSLVLKMPDRMLSGIAIYVSKVFNANFLVESSYNFHSVVTNKINSLIPVRLCSVPRYDASYRVDNLVAFTKSQCASITIGSQEGYRLANQAIAAAIQIWKPTRVSQSISYWTVPKVFRQVIYLATSPKEKVRLYLLLAWLHTVVQERLRYCPLGWSKIYKFNDSDLEAAMSMIDLLMVATAKGRANIDPAHLPWAALWILLRQAVYGGGVNSNWDQTYELVGEAPNQAKTSSDNTSSQPGRMRQMERTSKEFLKTVCNGEIKQTNPLTSLIGEITTGSYFIIINSKRKKEKPVAVLIFLCFFLFIHIAMIPAH